MQALKNFCRAVHIHPVDRELWEEDVHWTVSLLQKKKEGEEHSKEEIDSHVTSPLTITEIEDNEDTCTNNEDTCTNNEDTCTNNKDTCTNNEDTCTNISVEETKVKISSKDVQHSNDITQKTNINKKSKLPQNYVLMRNT